MIGNKTFSLDRSDCEVIICENAVPGPQYMFMFIPMDAFKNIKSMKIRDLEVLRHPLLSHLSLGFLSLCYRLARFKLALNNECSEPVIQQVALGLQETKRVL